MTKENGPIRKVAVRSSSCVFGISHRSFWKHSTLESLGCYCVNHTHDMFTVML